MPDGALCCLAGYRLAVCVLPLVQCGILPQNIMERILPKKSLGQHFLTDRNIAEKIVREFDTKPGEVVVEIGPGEGALTGLLVEQQCRLVAIELDPRAAERIRKQYQERVEVIEQDFLTMDLAQIAAAYGVERLRVIGNIPYYITSPILFHLIGARATVNDATLMMQLEVAERLVARPRTKEYGILAVALQTHAEVKKLFNVGPRCFYPPPNVNSAVVRLQFTERYKLEGIAKQHQQILRAAFSQRRKTLRNSLAQLIGNPEHREELLRTAGISPQQRAEELTIEDFLRLARVFAQTATSGSGQS